MVQQSIIRYKRIKYASLSVEKRRAFFEGSLKSEDLRGYSAICRHDAIKLQYEIVPNGCHDHVERKCNLYIILALGRRIKVNRRESLLFLDRNMGNVYRKRPNHEYTVTSSSKSSNPNLAHFPQSHPIVRNHCTPSNHNPYSHTSASTFSSQKGQFSFRSSKEEPPQCTCGVP